MSEAIEPPRKRPPCLDIFPASWINANFDVWIGHSEDVRAWDMLRDAREVYAARSARRQRIDGHHRRRLATRLEALLAAEGSDWCWWYGPEHGSSNDAEFDALYRKHLTEVYAALGEEVPDALTHPIKQRAEMARREDPSEFLRISVDGRETSYFEWMGAGLYCTDPRRRYHARAHPGVRRSPLRFRTQTFLSASRPVPKLSQKLRTFNCASLLGFPRNAHYGAGGQRQARTGCVLEQGGACLLHPETLVMAAFGKIIEVGIARELFDLRGRRQLLLSVALWEGGLPVEVLPVDGMLELVLGEENFAWGTETEAKA